MNASQRNNIHRLLLEDPTWSAYALADLQPQFDAHCQWHLIDEEERQGVMLLFDALDPTILFMSGSVEAMQSTMAQADLPSSVFVSMCEEHESLFDQYYTLGERRCQMWRMFLPKERLFELPKKQGLRHLSIDDGEALRRLYGEGGPFAPDSFDPYQIENGVFFGFFDDEQSLVAAGGTHIVDWQGIGLQGGVAGIGNMYTHPNHRGRGYAGLILQAVVATLQAKNVTNIVLNVNQQNRTARKIYERYGFEIHCPFIEGIGLKNN